MRPTKSGQIARYHTPYPTEDPNQLYIVLDAFEDVERPRAHIKALFSGMGRFTPINTVLLDDLEVVEMDISDLIG